MARVPSRRVLPALVALGALAVAGCTDPHDGQLLLADVPGGAEQVGDLAIYAVEPGDDPADESTRVSASALAPLDVTTTAEDGQVWVNSLGRVWDGSVLLAYGEGDGQGSVGANVVTVGEPGGDQDELLRTEQARTTVLRRGAFVQGTDGCVLATSATDVERVGEGNCAISLDERWVASWPLDGQGLTIRDLRHGTTEEVDLQVGNAGVLSADARVLVIARVAEGFQGVLIDATDGSEVARTDTYEFLDLTTIGADAEGFVLQSGDAEGTALLHVDTEGEVTTIDEGFYLVPVVNGAEVTYLRYQEDLADSTLERWSPGDDGPEPLTVRTGDGEERPARGFLGAGSPDGEHVVMTRETSQGTEFWREEGGTGELRRVLTLGRAPQDADPSAGSGSGVAISQMQVQGSMVHLQVDGASTSAYVRIDMVGDRSDVPVQGVEGLLFESLDVDGTALLTRAVGAADAPQNDVLVVGPHEDEAERRATVGRTAANLIHEGTIYLTDVSDPTSVTVSSLRVHGDDDPEVLYTDKQVAGATWPQWGGATRAVFVTPRLLLEQVQRNSGGAATATP